MRRVLLLAALAAPGLAAAQALVQGQITFVEGQTDTIHGRWINATECATANAKVNLSWIAAPVNVTSFPATGVSYQVYASNKPPQNNTCYISATGTDIKAAPVGATLTGQGQTVQLQPYTIADLVAAAGITNCAGVQGDTDFYVCTQAWTTDTSGNKTTVGFAVGTMTISVTPPGQPTWGSAKPADDGTLLISWTPSTASPTAYDFVVSATATADASSPHTTIATQTSSTLLGGLTNDVTYDIKVTPRSPAGNEGPPATGQGTPVMVLNFWEVYQGTPGAREQGGCASGAGGPVALLGLAALLAKLRRRA